MRKAYLWISIIFSVTLAIFISYYFKTDSLYTHFFYIPIVIASFISLPLMLVLGFGFTLLHVLLEYTQQGFIDGFVITRMIIIWFVTLSFYQVKRLEEKKNHEIDKLTYMSTHDPLTLAYNRQYLNRLLNADFIYPVTIFMCDINGLKKANDLQGHASGDRLIIRTCEILQTAVRKEDSVIRMGGDEFAIISPACDEIDAEVVLTRIKKRLVEVNKGEDPLKVSFSIGYSICKKGDSLWETLKKADSKMYRDKAKYRKTIK